MEPKQIGVMDQYDFFDTWSSRTDNDWHWIAVDDQTSLAREGRQLIIDAPNPIFWRTIDIRGTFSLVHDCCMVANNNWLFVRGNIFLCLKAFDGS